MREETKIEVVFGQETQQQGCSVYWTNFYGIGGKIGLEVMYSGWNDLLFFGRLGYHYSGINQWGPFLQVGFTFRAKTISHPVVEVSPLVVTQEQEVAPKEEVVEPVLEGVLEESFAGSDQAFFDKERLTLVLTNVHYAINADAVPKESIPSLLELVGILKRYPRYSILISGHTDDRGSDAYNMRLSERRAKNIAQFFVEAGIEPGRVKWKGYGETQPLVKGTSEEARSLNRRVEIQFIEEQE